MYTPSPVRSNLAALPLQPLLDARWELGWRHVAACAWFCLLFLYFNYIPLFHSDLWGHVHYGKWMLEHHQLVDQDPFMPLAQGMHSANNAWLSQVIMAQLHAWGGPHYLSNLFAVVAVGAYLVHARTFYLLSGRLGLAVLGTMLLLAIGWSRHAIIRPEIFGNLCFALLFWLVVSGGDRSADRNAARGDSTEGPATASGFGWRLWIGAPLLMLAWVNLHGSFAVGLVFLGCHAVAVAVEEGWRAKSLTGLLQSRRFQRWAILLQLCVAATLINPYGLDMLLETWRFGKNPNLKDVLEWYPLKLIDMEGLQFGLSAVLLLVALRWSRRPVRLVEVLLFTVFLVAMAPTIRMIAWYAPVFLFVWTPHAADAWRHLERRLRTYLQSLESAAQPPAATMAGDAIEPVDASAVPPAASEATRAADQDTGATSPVENEEPRPAIRFAGTLACGLLVWTTFAFSPISQPILGGKSRTLARVHSRGTPLAITKYLREHPPGGMIFGPQWWGDWLAWDGPPGTQVFMTTHVHLAPSTVWKDYLRVARGLTGWQQTLDRYAIDTLIADKTLQPALVDAVRGTDAWQVIHEDAQGVIAQRKSARQSAEPEPTDPADHAESTEPAAESTSERAIEPTEPTSEPVAEPVSESERSPA